MAYSYKDDLDRFNEKKNDSKKLTLNSLNLASDAGLNPTYGGDGSGGGGSEDSPVKAADVRFTTDDTMYSGTLDNVFPDQKGVFVYYPDEEDYPALVTDMSFRNDIAGWNAGMDDGIRVVAPQPLEIYNGNFNVFVVSGSAEIIEIDDEPVLYVTGDCEIEISVITSDH